MHKCSGVEGEDADWRLYPLPIVTGGPKPQEGGGFARARIVVDSKVYPGIPMPQRMAPRAWGTVVATGGDLADLFCVLL